MGVSIKSRVKYNVRRMVLDLFVSYITIRSGHYIGNLLKNWQILNTLEVLPNYMTCRPVDTSKTKLLRR